MQGSFCDGSFGQLWRIAMAVAVVGGGCGGSSRPARAFAPAEALREAPDGLAARGESLLAVRCPPGARLYERRRERANSVELRRHCTTREGAREGPVVDYRRSAGETFLFRRSTKDGRRDGLYVRIADGFATEMHFARGAPVGAYRRWNVYGGRLLVEGSFDDGGRLDGTWRFWDVEGHRLSETTLQHGTGTIEVWRTPAGVRSTPRRLAHLSCRDGLLDGPSTLHRVLDGATLWGAREYDLSASFTRGVADGPWERSADGHVERGRYEHGRPVGDWEMVGIDLCYHSEVLGDVERCAVPLAGGRYQCLDVTSPACDHPAVDGRDVTAGPSPESGWPGPREHLDVERCELPEGFWE